MDISKVKDWTIVEGKVKELKINNQVLWGKKAVDLLGTWKFNDTLTLDNWSYWEGIVIGIRFTSDIEWYGLSFSANSSEDFYLNFLTESESPEPAYSSTEGLWNYNYPLFQTITITDTSILDSDPYFKEEFIKWFTSNATKIS